jgi:uncharacterized phage infection (PIP) family protein YhgE
MTHNKGLSIFVAGLGIGVAATLVFADGELRSRLGKALGAGSQRVSEALSDPEATWNSGAQAIRDAKDQLKNKIDDAADAVKKAADQAAARSREAAHAAGEHLERGARRLQNA